MANVLFLAPVFPPDGVSTAQIMGELAVDLRRYGHSVSVVTTQPHYNYDDVARAAQPLTPIWRGAFFRSSYQGIPVIHTRMPSREGGIRSRLIGFIVFHALGLVAALFLSPRPDVIIVPSSPLLSGGFVAWLIGVFTGARYIYNVQEMYPDLAIQMGQLDNRALIHALRTLERFVYRTAGGVTVITRGMQAKLLAAGVPTEKLHFVPNFVDVDELTPSERTNGFSKEHRLDGSFVVSYAGNIGFAQGLDVLVAAADLLKNEKGILFLFVGNGVARASLVEEASRRGLSNVRFVEHQPYARVSEIYASSDISVVSQLDTIAADAIPSKVYRIMACARPILAIASSTSELGAVVRESGGGVAVKPSALEVADAIAQLSRQTAAERAAMGRSGRAFALANVSRPTITRRYDELVRSIDRSRARIRDVGQPEGSGRSVCEQLKDFHEPIPSAPSGSASSRAAPVVRDDPRRQQQLGHDARHFFRNPTTSLTTRSTCAPLSSGKIGSASVSCAAASDAGKSPA